MIVFATGLGFTFMPLTLAAVSQVDEGDTGIASGVLNTTQQIGGSMGLALLTTVATTVITSRAEGERNAPPHPRAGWVHPRSGSCCGGWLDGRVPGFDSAGCRCLHHHHLRHQGQRGRVRRSRTSGGRLVTLLGLRLRLVHLRRRRRSPTQPSRLPPLARAVVRILPLGSMDQCRYRVLDQLRRILAIRRSVNRLADKDLDGDAALPEAGSLVVGPQALRSPECNWYHRHLRSCCHAVRRQT